MARSSAQAAWRRRRSSHGAVMTLPGGGRSCRGFGSTRSIDSRPTMATRRSGNSSAGARSCSSIFHFRPDYAAGCPACSSIADGFNGFAFHPRRPRCNAYGSVASCLEKLQAYKRRMGGRSPGLRRLTAISTTT